MGSEIIQSVAYDIYDDFHTYQLHIFTKFNFIIFSIIPPPHPTIKLMSEDERELARQNTIT
jgi:hypothetical protein